jgi:AcrR family transcriptional regulator
VLAAALEVLGEEGLAGFTMEAVARRAAASKATLYRHWPSTGALLVDAMDATFRPFPAPDTGSLRQDVTILLEAFVTMLRDTPFPKLLATFIDAAEREPALRDRHADLTRRRREPLLAALTRARDRGELAPGRDLELTTDLLTAPFFYRRFVAHHPIPSTLVSEVITEVLHA